MINLIHLFISSTHGIHISQKIIINSVTPEKGEMEIESSTFLTVFTLCSQNVNGMEYTFVHTTANLHYNNYRLRMVRIKIPYNQC